MTCGIYQIKNKINGKIYIGQSINIEKRFLDHKYALKNNIHQNKHLQNAVNKYNIKNFDFSIITPCQKENLNNFEKWFICQTGASNQKLGYNKTIGGDFNPMWDEEIKQKAKINQTKKEARIIKNGKHYRKQAYCIRYKGKTIVNNIDKEILEILFNKYFENGILKDNYSIDDIKKEMKKITIKNQSINRKGVSKNHWNDESKKNQSRKKNTTGYLFVDKIKCKTCTQKFRYRYRYRDKNKDTISITAININKLEEKVKERNLPWEKIKLEEY